MTSPLHQLSGEAELLKQDWSEALPWKVSIHRNGLVTALPQPLTYLAWTDQWDYVRQKTSLVAGDSTTDISPDGVDILIRGRIVVIDKNYLLAFNELKTLRDQLNVQSAAPAFDLYIHYDAAAPAYRSFRECVTEKLRADLSDHEQLEYEIHIHADDPTLYESAPAS